MFCMKKSVVFYSKRPSSPAKNWNFAWKMVKKPPKKVPKRAPSPAKSEVLHEKKSFFLLKNTTHPRKKQKFWLKKKYFFSFYFSFAFFLFIFLLDFFSWPKKNWDSFYNRGKKNEVLHEKLKIVLPMGILKTKIEKKSRPPTSPNV